MNRTLASIFICAILAGCAGNSPSTSGPTPATTDDDVIVDTVDEFPDIDTAIDAAPAHGAAAMALATALAKYPDVQTAYLVVVSSPNGRKHLMLVPIFDGEPTQGALDDSLNAFAGTDTSGDKLELMLVPPANRGGLADNTPIYVRP